MSKDFSLEKFSYEVIRYLIRDDLYYNDMSDEELFKLELKYGMVTEIIVTQEDIDNDVTMRIYGLSPGDNWCLISNELKECIA